MSIAVLLVIAYRAVSLTSARLFAASVLLLTLQINWVTFVLPFSQFKIKEN
jgi:hypothetical protein